MTSVCSSRARAIRPAIGSTTFSTLAVRRSASAWSYALSMSTTISAVRGRLVSSGLLDKRDNLLGDRLDDLRFLFLEPTLVAAAHDPERPGADVRVGTHRQAADLVPAQPFDLEWVHGHRDGRERAVAVVHVDRPRD